MKTSYSVIIYYLKTSPVLIKIMDKITLDDHCGRMAKDFKSRRAFFNHVDTHSEDFFNCPKCPTIWEGGPENKFNTKKALATHIFEYHNSENKCSNCDKTFSTSTNLKKHELLHQNQATETCSKCDKKFATKFSLHQHTKNCYPEIASTTVLSCDECDKIFDSIRTLLNNI